MLSPVGPRPNWRARCKPYFLFLPVGGVPEGHPPLGENQQGIKGRTRDGRNRDRRPNHVDRHATDFRGNPEAHADDWRAEKLGTIAPIMASVALIFSALKMKGMAAGSRKANNVRDQLAP